jgi:hypothetical protein
MPLDSNDDDEMRWSWGLEMMEIAIAMAASNSPTALLIKQSLSLHQLVPGKTPRTTTNEWHKATLEKRKILAQDPIATHKVGQPAHIPRTQENVAYDTSRR